jgi:hypothetical protein
MAIMTPNTYEYDYLRDQYYYGINDAKKQQYEQQEELQRFKTVIDDQLRYMNSVSTYDQQRMMNSYGSLKELREEYNYYAYRNIRKQGPTQKELDENPSLRDAWEQYEMIRTISK